MNNNCKDKISKLELALRRNLKKRKLFQKKLKKKNKQMPVLSDKWIKEMASKHKMISPFADKQIRENQISYGLSSFGYDARVSNEFGGITHSFAVLETKLLFLKFFGSTITESTSVKILNSFDTLAS